MAGKVCLSEYVLVVRDDGLEELKDTLWACMYSLPLLPSSSLLLRVNEPFCQNMGVTSNNYLLIILLNI